MIAFVLLCCNLFSFYSHVRGKGNSYLAATIFLMVPGVAFSFLNTSSAVKRRILLIKQFIRARRFGSDVLLQVLRRAMHYYCGGTTGRFLLLDTLV